jgi:hypothetical protein
MEELNNQSVDAALILEGKLKERIYNVVHGIVSSVVAKEVEHYFNEQKEAMLMELTLAVGKCLRVIENEGRKPLWESTPEEFGFDPKMMNTTGMVGAGESHASPVQSEGYPPHQLELENYAVQEQSRPQI